MRATLAARPIVVDRSIQVSSIALLLTLLTLSATLVVAQPSQVERETARSLMDDGDRLREAGDLWGALERFQAADAIMHVPTTGLDVARIQASLLQLVEARGTALSVATSPEVPGESKVFAAARREAAQLAQELAPRVPDVTVVLEPALTEARVGIDGTQLPRLARPLPFKLNPGSHMLDIEAAGYERHTQQFSLADGQHAELKVVLQPKPAAAAPAPALAVTPTTVEVAADRGEDPNQAGRTRGYVGLIAGGAVLAGGIVTGILSATKTSDVHDTCGGYECPAAQRSELTTAYTLANIANVAIPVGVLGIGYGLFELLTHPARDRERPASLRVGLDLPRPGVWVRGEL